MSDSMGTPRPSPRHKSEDGMPARAKSRLLRWWAENGSLLTGATHLPILVDPIPVDPIPVDGHPRAHGRRKAVPARSGT
jgi:hypothetical protein